MDQRPDHPRIDHDIIRGTCDHPVQPQKGREKNTAQLMGFPQIQKQPLSRRQTIPHRQSITLIDIQTDKYGLYGRQYGKHQKDKAYALLHPVPYGIVFPLTYPLFSHLFVSSAPPD